MARDFSNASTDRSVVTANSTINSMPTFSMLFTMKWDSAPAAFDFLLSKETSGTFVGPSIGVSSTDGDLFLQVGRSSSNDSFANLTGAADMTVGTWYNNAFTYTDSGSNSGISQYLGPYVSDISSITPDEELTGSGTHDDSGQDLYMGTYSDGTAGTPFVMSRFSLFNTVLSHDECREWFAHPYVRTDCVMWHEYGIYEDGSTVLDLSGNGNNGAITGATEVDHIQHRIIKRKSYYPSFAPVLSYVPRMMMTGVG